MFGMNRKQFLFLSVVGSMTFACAAAPAQNPAHGAASGSGSSETSKTLTTTSQRTRTIVVQARPGEQDAMVTAEIAPVPDVPAAPGAPPVPAVGSIHVTAPKVMVQMQASGKKEKAAFLGVTTTPVAMATRAQMSIQRGVGLTVESVEKGSPADTAGVQQYDILVKLDDQLLVNPQQFGVVVRTHKAGETVSLEIIRKGQPLTLKVTLAEKEMVVRDDANPLGWETDNVWGNSTFVAPQGLATLRGPLEQQELQNFLVDVNNSKQTMTMSMSDDENTLTLTTREGKKQLTATDKSGTVVFNGPVDTPEQRKAMPPEIAAKLEKLEARPNVIRLSVEQQKKAELDASRGGAVRPQPATQPEAP